MPVKTLTTRPGHYVMHHSDYSTPIDIIVGHNATGIYWEALDRRHQYYGDSSMFAFWVRCSLNTQIINTPHAE